MLGIKLKSRHRLAILLIAATILIPSFFVTGHYGTRYNNAALSQKAMEHNIVLEENFLEKFVMAGYVFYNTENEKTSSKDMRDFFQTDNYTWNKMEEFNRFYPFLDYQVLDENGRVIAKSIVDSGRVVTEDNLESFTFGMVMSYDKYGVPDVSIRQGKYKSEQSIVLRKIINQFDESLLTASFYKKNEAGEFREISLEKPKERTYIFAMTEKNLDTYLGENYYLEDYSVYGMEDTVFLMMLLVMLAALLYPCVPFLRTGQEKIFRTVPFEPAVLVLGLTASWAIENCNWLVEASEGRVEVVDVLIWCLVFTVIYWGTACLRQIYTLGPKRYMRERTLLYRFRGYIRNGWRRFFDNVKRGTRKIYHSFDDLDLSDKNTKTILKLILCNFVILVFICSLWFYGIMALIIYSVVLFFILRKYFNDLREKYGVLLRATNEIAEGNLEVEITEDLGVFSPFRKEIGKIQTGFKKAVDEEVKSQRMKSELITNVSHDLKTPLTAIITYVNLLKDETDEEKKKDYIQVLEKKSLRLKALIEDLFEISKASSKNVTLNIVDVDVINLFKQVKLELEDKITDAGLDFRCTYPAEKLVVPLDSQKTYRIFENLLVNVVKYALPHTRVYTEFECEGENVVFRMKNISAAELDFNTEEITERFVRGDASRNTEGSGLGLAIVKSFAELQKGSIKVETEADLFKVEVRFPRD